MNLPEDVISHNIELTCLGKNVNLDSPEAGAAALCMAEVSKLRRDAGQAAVKSNDVLFGFLSGMSADEARYTGETQFNKIMMRYIDHKAKPSNFFFKSQDQTKDTLESRELEFSEIWNNHRR